MPRDWPEVCLAAMKATTNDRAGRPAGRPVCRDLVDCPAVKPGLASPQEEWRPFSAQREIAMKEPHPALLRAGLALPPEPDDRDFCRDPGCGRHRVLFVYWAGQVPARLDGWARPREAAVGAGQPVLLPEAAERRVARAFPQLAFVGPVFSAPLPFSSLLLFSSSLLPLFSSVPRFSAAHSAPATRLQLWARLAAALNFRGCQGLGPMEFRRSRKELCSLSATFEIRS